jgi:hypothetical protein
MADRYQDRPFPADDDYDRGGHQAPSRGETDPLAELARLIGQTDPFANLGRANQTVAPRGSDRDQYHEPELALEADDAPAGPPPWMQRAAAHDAHEPQPEPDFDSSVHPVQRYGAAHAADQDYHQAPSFAAAQDPHHDQHHDQHEEADPDRYDDALYGQLPSAPGLPQEAGYEDPYAYQDDYAAGDDDQPRKSRRGGMITVAVVLALAVVGTGAAFAYRTYVGSPRSGEPPIIKADPGPNKVIPPTQSADASGKLIQDRMAGGSTEKLVSREEAPIDPSKSGPRVVFPPLNQNANPPPAASVAPNTRALAGTGNGTLGGDEPRKIRTFAVKGDQPDPAATPVAKPAAAPAARTAAPAPAPAAAPPPRAPSPSAANANASTNAPMSLSPQAAPAAEPPHTRVASTTSAPQPITPTATSGGSGYMVQVSSQRNEADAQSSFRSLQGKFPSVLGSRAPLIKRADLGEKGVYYRAMVGPFGSPDEAKQFCGNLKSAGGQCVVQGN